ncbi:MAG: 3-isopropylmalate dehydratase large subunit [Chromatiales bacterium]|nr:3-isopropylmalate dehydratase large subunit [Chromatiales bacterium]
MSAPRTLFDKIWERVCLTTRDDGQSLLYIDRHIGHEGTVGGFATLRERGLKFRRPDLTFTSADHFVSTHGPNLDDITNPRFRKMVVQFDNDAKEFGHTAFALGDERRGIVHVVGPEQGITQPGLLMVCGDSHTATHGAFGAFAFGIGSTELVHVLATQTLWQKKPKTMRITLDGTRPPGVTAKDLILAVIAEIGANGATGHVLEYAGEAVTSMSMEERMTVCNMSIEAGGRAGIIAPDDTTIEYLRGRPFAPSGDDWERACEYWRQLPTDAGASFDREVHIRADQLAPMVTWGVSPEDGVPVTGQVPDPAHAEDAARREQMQAALDYMGLTAGTRIDQIRVDHVFIGSCTNGRIEDLRAAAEVVRGKKVAITGLVVPGSSAVKRQAEAEGLHQVFVDAGLEWRETGCSMSCSFNGDQGKPQERWASTSNRNFVGRQGPQVRTHLVGPAMAAAAALTGRFTDVRSL